MPSSGQRERIVDLLKGICILLVCFTHYQWDTAEREAFLFAWWVDMAVPVFMILSGYVYGRSCFNKNLTALSHAYAPRLLWNKILRLTLPVVLIYAAALIRDFYRYGEISYPIVHTFLQGGRGPGAYYYPVMMQIVFTLPLIHRVVTRYEEKGLLLCLLANAAYEVLHVVYLVPVESHRLLMFRYIFLLAAGCFLSIGKPLKIPYQIGMVLVGVGFNLAYLYGGYEPTYLIHWTTTAFVPAMMIVPPVFLLVRRCRLHFAPLEFIGKASYNIFLAQMLYYYGFSALLYQQIESRKWQLLLSVTISVGAGVIFYLLETPLTKWVQKTTGKWFLKQQAK